MKLKFCKNPLMLLMMALLFLSGCATAPQQTAKRYVWPLPPAEPRIEWIKSYYGEDDFPKSGFGKFVETIVGKPKTLKFEKIIDVASNGKGVIYVADIGNGGILVVDTVNEKVDFWVKSSDPDAGMGITPYYLALDDNDNIYAAGIGKKEINILDPAGKLIRRIDFTDKVESPGGLAVDSKGGKIYLVDNAGSKVAVFDLAGAHLFTFGAFGEADGEFNRPTEITLNSLGEVIVVDTFNARIQIFDAAGKFLRKFGARGDGSASFYTIKGVAVDSDDNIYVTDSKTNQIKIFNTKGDYLLTIGTAYSVGITRKEAPGGFLVPMGIYIDKNDSIFVADSANYRFQHLKYLKESEAGSVVDGGK
jgi:DNA-binding beta-propeller fold protein YncE